MVGRYLGGGARAGHLEAVGNLIASVHKLRRSPPQNISRASPAK